MVSMIPRKDRHSPSVSRYLLPDENRDTSQLTSPTSATFSTAQTLVVSESVDARYVVLPRKTDV